MQLNHIWSNQPRPASTRGCQNDIEPLSPNSRLSISESGGSFNNPLCSHSSSPTTNETRNTSNGSDVAVSGKQVSKSALALIGKREHEFWPVHNLSQSWCTALSGVGPGLIYIYTNIMLAFLSKLEMYMSSLCICVMYASGLRCAY